jgi:hypothetical protein
MKKLLLFLLFVIFYSSIVSSDGPVPMECATASVADLPSNVGGYIFDDEELGCDITSALCTQNATHRVLFSKTVDDVEYPVADFDVTYGCDGDSFEFTDLVVDLDIDENKIIIHEADSRITGSKSLFIQKLGTLGHNRIVVCENATDITQVHEGCAGYPTVTKETLINPSTYSGEFTIDEQEEEEIEEIEAMQQFGDSAILTLDDYWKVEGVTGTGVGSFFTESIGGEGTTEVLEEGSTLNLDEDTSLDYISRKNVEHYVLFGGKEYMLTVEYVDSNNEYASVYIENLEKSITLSSKDQEEIDLDSDGEIDMILEVTQIDYPEVYFTTSVLLKEQEFDLSPREKTIRNTERGCHSPCYDEGGVWNVFVKMTQEKRVQLLSLMIFFTFVVLFFVLVGGRVLSKIWHTI